MCDWWKYVATFKVTIDALLELSAQILSTIRGRIVSDAFYRFFGRARKHTGQDPFAINTRVYTRTCRSRQIATVLIASESSKLELLWQFLIMLPSSGCDSETLL